jgi:gamma-glutamyl hercynylcysteine S-oxide synthase
MHQETLAYMWHELPVAVKRQPALYTTVPPSAAAVVQPSRVRIPGGTVTLGTREADEPFAWDNEMPAHAVAVDDFAVDIHDVTNAEYMEFVDAGGYRDERWWRAEDWAWIRADGIAHPRFWTQQDGRWLWRAMFEHIPLPGSWPVYVTWAEAAAFARWRGQRLLTEAEFHRAAYAGDQGSGIRDPGSPTPGPVEHKFPWGNDMPRRPPANFDFLRWDPQPAGTSPEAVSAFGVHDLVGNGWEWTSTPFGPFAGFAPMASYPEYSADFFDEEHFVLKGASPFTARALVRRGFRNWFRPRYPYVYAAFRCASGPAR